MPGTPTTPSLRAFNARNPQGTVLAFEYTVDPTSAAIKVGDPVKEVAGGMIKRAGVADTAIVGFALEPSDPSTYVAREIPVPPAKTDASGNVLIRVAVAGGGNIFTGATKNAPVQANVTKLFDLLVDPANAGGFVIDNSAAPVVSLIQIISIVRDVQSLTRVDFIVPAAKSQFSGVGGA